MRTDRVRSEKHAIQNLDTTFILNSARALVCGCQMPAECDVCKRKKIFDVTASLKMVWVEKQAGETFSFSWEKK